MLKRIIAFLLIVGFSGSLYAYTDSPKNHAFHVSNIDRLSSFDKEYNASADWTTYTPDLGIPGISDIPPNVVIDEVFLKLTYKPGFTSSSNPLLYISCTAAFVLSESELRIKNDGSYLYAQYGFADPNKPDEQVFADGNCWKFIVNGNDPVSYAEVFVSYHVPNSTAMPSLYAPDPYGVARWAGTAPLFTGGEDTLHAVRYSDVSSEWPDHAIDVGTPIDETNKKLIILIHGWNPQDCLNKFAPNSEDSTCGARAVSTDSIKFGWEKLIQNLGNNTRLSSEWTIARYDWAKDAATGPIYNYNPISNIFTLHPNNPKASRDAAHAHGRKLGKILQLVNPTEIHFIAHSAGNWVARRAADYLKRALGDNVTIQITSLDPYVNDSELSNIGEEEDWVKNFELTRMWVEMLDNYYSVDTLGDNSLSDLLGWTSGDYYHWNINRNIENFPNNGILFNDFMDSHGGPIYWYGNSANMDYESSFAGVGREGFLSSISQITQLSPNSKSTNNFIASGEWRYYSVEVPPNEARLTVEIVNSTNESIDLYVNDDSVPTKELYRCRSREFVGSQACYIDNPVAGRWFIAVHGFLHLAGNTSFDIEASLDSVIPGHLNVSPGIIYTMSGPEGGPFGPALKAYTLTNDGGGTLSYSVSTSASWISINNTAGSLNPGESTSVVVQPNLEANNLGVGTYNERLVIEDTTNQEASFRGVQLNVSAAQAVLSVEPADSFVSAGTRGGPFTSPSQRKLYTLTNNGGTPLNYSVTSSDAWINVDNNSGILDPGESTIVLVNFFNASANNLSAGTYNGTVDFINETNSVGGGSIAINFTVNPKPGRLSVSPDLSFNASGPEGGPISPTSTSYELTNTGDLPLNYSTSFAADWVSFSQGSGVINPNERLPVTVSFNENSNSLNRGGYSSTLRFSDTTNNVNVDRRVELEITAPPGVLVVTPLENYYLEVVNGGPIVPTYKSYTVSNTGGSTLYYTVLSNASWILDPGTNGLSAGFSGSADILIDINSALNMQPGTYTDVATIMDTTNNVGFDITVTLVVRPHEIKLLSDIAGGNRSVQPGSRVDFSIITEDSAGHSIGSEWQANCPSLNDNGYFYVQGSSTTDWRAPNNYSGHVGVCSIQATVGHTGLTSMSSTTIEVASRVPKLTIAIDDAVGGVVRNNFNATECSDRCEFEVATGTEVILTMLSEVGYVLSNYSTACIPIPNTNPRQCRVLVNQDLGVHFNFNVADYGFSVFKVGGGTVVSVSPGIDCGQDCVENYQHGTVVTLIATPDPDFIFGSWERCDSVVGNACTVTIENTRSVRAIFEPANVQMTVNSGLGGSITSNPVGIDCGVDCTEYYPNGTNVTLVAAPDSGYEFDQWVFCDSGNYSASCTMSMTINKTVDAIFAPIPMYTLDVISDAGGNVTSSPAGINCGADCSERYYLGEVVTLTATLLPGYDFIRWYGCDSGNDFNATCVKTIAGPSTVRTAYLPSTYNLNVVTNAGGSVTSDFPGIDCGVDCAQEYDRGTVVTLTAIPDSGYRIELWSGCDYFVNVNTCGVRMDAEKNVTVTFTQNPTHMLTVTSGTGGAVSSTPAGIDCGVTCASAYQESTLVTLTSTPDTGYDFDTWTGCDSVAANTCTVTMDAAKNVTASYIVNSYVLNVEPNVGGSVTSIPTGIDCGLDCSQSYSPNTVVVLTAIENTGYAFIGWSGCDTANGSSCTVTMSSNKTIVPNYDNVPVNHTLSVVVGEGGYTVSNPGGISGCDVRGLSCSWSYTEGTTVNLLARTNGGYEYGAWSGCDSIQGTDCVVTVTADRTVSLEFNARLAVAVGEGGAVTSNPVGIDCSVGQCTNYYSVGTSVVLTAAPDSGYTFEGWYGCDSVNGNLCTVAMDALKSIVANFTIDNYALIVSSSTGGVINSVPSGIDCGLDCLENYPYSTMVTLTALPDEGYVFSGWTGCDSSSNDSCTVTMSTTKDLSATFTQIPTHLLTVTSGIGGTVISEPGGFDCGISCLLLYQEGESITLTAIPDTGHSFDSWAGCESVAANTCTVTMDAAKNVTATYSINTYTLNVTTGTGGTVTSVLPGINCSVDCAEDYDFNTLVTLTATPNTGYNFNGWTGCDTGNAETCTVTMSSVKNVTAAFTQNPTYILSVSSSSGGTVTSEPSGIECGVSCSTPYQEGTVVSLTATPDANYSFDVWTGCDSVNGNICTVTMSAIHRVTVSFNLTRYDLNVTAGSGSTVISIPAGIYCGTDCIETYDINTPVTLTAVLDSGYIINGWQGCDTASGLTCIVNMASAKSVGISLTQVSVGNAPVVTAPDDMFISANSYITSVDLGFATAIDVEDGMLTALPDKAGMFVSGCHEVTWSATDSDGNSASDIQVVCIDPQANFAVNQQAQEGGVVVVEVLLSGEASVYPVEIPYTVSGTAAYPDDHDAVAGNLTINEGTSGSIQFSLINDGISGESGETVVFTMGTPVNAVQGTQLSHTVAVVEENLPPRVSMNFTQSGFLTTHLVAINPLNPADVDPVTIEAMVIDPNPGDQHSYHWGMLGNMFTDTDANPADAAFIFDPTVQIGRVYDFWVTVTDDGIPPMQTTSRSYVRLGASVGLADNVDTDGDGVLDIVEGYGDDDQDGIANYLDAINVPYIIQGDENNKQFYLVSTEPGLRIRQGLVAFSRPWNYLSVYVTLDNIHSWGTIDTSDSVNIDDDYTNVGGYFDFIVTGLPVVGQSVNVVIPLHIPVPANADYRKYFSGIGWQSFVDDAFNFIRSAPGAPGSCPQVGDSAYTDGLIEGYWCIQLTIQDGGPNDLDGEANGQVSDPGGIAVPPAVSQSPGSSNNSGSSGGGGGGHLGLLTLIVLGVVTLRRRFARRASTESFKRAA